jgi:hypothetical protein
MNKYKTFIALLGVLLFSCKKEDKTVPAYDENKIGYITIKFDSQVGDLNLVPDSPFYTTPLNHNYSISKFSYFVSNIVFVKQDSSTYSIPKDSSYFLIQENVGSSKILKLRVPEGDYIKVRFDIGIDSITSVSPLNTRVDILNPNGAAANMYWDPSKGYIYMNIEGTYIDYLSSNSTRHPYQFQIGGYGTSINNLRTTEVDFREYVASVRQSKGYLWPEVHIYVDAGKVFSGTTNIDFTQNDTIGFIPYSLNVSRNYRDMFTLAHVHDE